MTKKQLYKLLKEGEARLSTRIAGLESHKSNPTVLPMYERNTGYRMAVQDILGAMEGSPASLKTTLEG